MTWLHTLAAELSALISVVAAGVVSECGGRHRHHGGSGPIPHLSRRAENSLSEGLQRGGLTRGDEFHPAAVS